MLDNFLKAFKSSLTSANYDKFIAQLTTELTIQMEKAVFKIAFNRVSADHKFLIIKYRLLTQSAKMQVDFADASPSLVGLNHI